MKNYLIKIAFTLVVMFFLITCKTNRQTKDPIIQNFKIQPTEEITISELLGKQYTITKLNEVEEERIGRVNKVVIFQQNFFILSDDSRILRFNKDGDYISTLCKMGKGPDEYTRIDDFEVFEDNGILQIWIADHSSIKIFFDNATWEFGDAINFPLVVNKFTRIDTNHILIMSGQNEKSLALADIEGNILDSYLDQQVPFLTLKPFQFTRYNNSIAFMLGVSNTCVVFDTKTLSFSTMPITDSNEILTDEALIQLYQKYSTDFIFLLNQKTVLRNFRQYGSRTVIDYIHNKARIMAVINDDGTQRNAEISSIKNDITQDETNNFLYTLGVFSSTNKLAFIEEPITPQGKWRVIEF